MIKFREPVAYRGIGEKNDGIIVKVEDALSYSMERCGLVHTDGGTEDDRDEFDKYIVDWFYSGEWISVYDEDEI